jgi:tetratricopeptide (TPR) repeat protein
MAIKVFLSHASMDKDLIRAIHRQLTKNIAWFDEADIENGDAIPEKINEGLKSATHFVLFWSRNAERSNWIKAELNAAFVKIVSGNCKFMIFTVDKTPLPDLLKPYKYEPLDMTDIEESSRKVVEIINSLSSVKSEMKAFVNRTKELGDIENASRKGYKLIVLNGILGIGKSSLSKEAIRWIYLQNSYILVNFDTIPGLAELSLCLSKETKLPLVNDNMGEGKQTENIRYFLESIASKNISLILKDVKSWLTDNGEPNEYLKMITDTIALSKVFTRPVIMTSSRFIVFPNVYNETTYQIKISALEDEHISEIIRNNLPESFKDYDYEQNKVFSKEMFGYPLGAKLAAFQIANKGYNYYLAQPYKIRELKIGLAKQFISDADISDGCIEYLKINSLVKSRMRNEEYSKAFPEMLPEDIAKFSDEAFFAGIVKIDEDGCYQLEPLVKDYYYSLAFQAENKKEICDKLESFLLGVVSDSENPDYLRLLPSAIHILAHNNKFNKACELRAEMTATMVTSMWDQYNNRDYEDALRLAEQLLSLDERIFLDKQQIDALYVKSLCLARLDKYNEAQKILEDLITKDSYNPRYDTALGRIEKHQEKFESAIILFNQAIQKNSRHISAYRELAECYLYLNDLSKAKSAISDAKRIDDSNLYIILLESHVLQKEGRIKDALHLIESEFIPDNDPAQVSFRRGRIYDELGDIKRAIECYEKALENNTRMYDAKLCLLSHQISKGNDCSNDIDSLKKKLKGKRKYILTNIEARYIGYHDQDEEKALRLLEEVDSKYIDIQWYAVKIQLLEKQLQKQESLDRRILAKQTKEKLDETKAICLKKFGIKDIINEKYLLPDA